MLTANSDKMNSSTRYFNLKLSEGTSARTDTGILDKKLFTGDNKLKAEMDQETSLWSLSYENGNIPQTLKQQFTSFSKCKQFADAYFKKRNVEIVEILNG